MRKPVLFLSMLVVLLLTQACGQSPEYGKGPLVLDDFGFDLDIPHFFQDERIFRYTHDEFSVSTEEYRLDDDSVMTGFIQYSTRQMSTSRPLASYAGVEFEDLGLVTDWDDEHVLMAYGGTSYGDKAGVSTLIKGLTDEFGQQPQLAKGGFMHDNVLYLLFGTDRKGVRFAFPLPDVDAVLPDGPDIEDWAGNGPVLTPEVETAIEAQLGDRQDVQFHFFVYRPELNAAFDALHGRSGFLVNFR